MSSKSRSRYTVYAYSSFHLMGDAEKYLVGELGDCESGIAVCKKLIDDFLQLHRSSAESPESLLAEYEASGPDPYIESDDATCRFSAAQYVRRRIGEIFG